MCCMSMLLALISSHAQPEHAEDKLGAETADEEKVGHQPPDLVGGEDGLPQ